MGLLMGGDRMNRFKNLKNRLKLFKPTYDKRETAKADMLEIYTRWRQGEKLSRKEMQLLQASEQHRELEPLLPLALSLRDGEECFPVRGTPSGLYR